MWICEEIQPIFPSSRPEIIYLEFLNMLKPTRVCELAGGVGKLSLACVRLNIPGMVFARNETHVEVIKEAMEAIIISENIDRIDRGFLSKRYMSRARSLGASSAGAGSAAGESAATDVIPVAAAPAATGGDVPAAAGGDDDDSSSTTSE